MIAEENFSNNPNHRISVSNSNVIFLINKLMIEVIPHFKSYLISGFYKKKGLNENELTQFYTKQAQILIRKKDLPFNIEGEYKDAYNLSKGFSDFFFYPNEQNISTASIFSVESKILPAPAPKSREKEYVIGIKNNGGIERYKTEKHGKGLIKCGMLGFIEDKNSKHWFNEINNWIEDLSKINSDWKKDEILTVVDSTADYNISKSIAYQKKGSIELSHLWILLN